MTWMTSAEASRLLLELGADPDLEYHGESTVAYMLRISTHFAFHRHFYQKTLYLVHASVCEPPILAGTPVRLKQIFVDKVNRRQACLDAVLQFLAGRRFNKSPVLARVPMDVMRLIAKDVWTTRCYFCNGKFGDPDLWCMKRKSKRLRK